MDTPLPVKSGPKDFFLNLLGLATLYASVVFTLVLLFQYINVQLPEPGSYAIMDSYDLIRVASSVLIVVFPAFLIIWWIIGKDLRREPERRHLRIRKWLTYLTLFVTAVTIIIDLIVLVYNFYNGELTSRFALKILSVFIVSGAVFWYYLWDLKRTDYESRKPRTIAWIASVATLILLVSGFFIAGSPATQRMRRLDERRVEDLRSIQYQVDSYWNVTQKLPVNLGDLSRQFPGYVPPTDPETGAAYEYRIASEQSFSKNAYEICATFTYPSAESDTARYKYYAPWGTNTWEYGIGRSCFLRAPENAYPKPLKAD